MPMMYIDCFANNSWSVRLYVKYKILGPCGFGTKVSMYGPLGPTSETLPKHGEGAQRSGTASHFLSYTAVLS